MTRIGVLSLQGGFDLHAKKIAELGFEPIAVRKKDHLAGLSGLAIPGGESSVLLYLTDENFRQEIRARVIDGMPLLATCAGLIFIAEQVQNPEQESLQLLPVSVRRNAYGRQKDSFIARDLPFEPGFERLCGDKSAHRITEAVFIRAPKILSCGKNVEVLARLDGDPILVRYKNIVASTFHPELVSQGNEIHRAAFLPVE